MTNESTLRIGIAGFGRLAREYYIPALASLSEAHLVAVADPLKSSQRTAQALFSLKAYADLEEMLAAEALDAVLIASPPSSHVSAWRAAREQGLRLLSRSHLRSPASWRRCPR